MNGPDFFTCEIHNCPQTGKAIRVTPPDINEGRGLPTMLFKIKACTIGGALIECRKCGQIVAVVR